MVSAVVACWVVLCSWELIDPVLAAATSQATFGGDDSSQARPLSCAELFELVPSLAEAFFLADAAYVELAESCVSQYSDNPLAWATLGRVRYFAGVKNKYDRYRPTVEALRLASLLNPLWYDEEYAIALAMDADYQGIVDLINPNLDTASSTMILRWGEAMYFLKKMSSKDLYMQISKWVSDHGYMIEQDLAQAKAFVYLEFFLCKLADNLQEYDDAWRHATYAHQIVLEKYQDSRKAEQRSKFGIAFVNGIVTTFTAFGFNNKPQYLDSNERPIFPKRGVPIFVVGLERSGTSLLEQMLSMHPDIFGLGETQLLDHLSIPDVDCVQHVNIEEAQCRMNIGAGLTAADAELSKRYRRAIIELYESQTQNKAHYPNLDNVPRYLTDKLPLNWRNIPLISTFYPDAKIIVLRRDFRDVLISQYFAGFHLEYNFHANTPEGIASHMQLFSDTLSRYSALGYSWLDVSYESLVQDPRRVLKNVLVFLDLDWNDLVLEHHKSTRVPQTVSRSQATQKVYSTSVRRWSKYAKYLPQHPIVHAPQELFAEQPEVCED